MMNMSSSGRSAVFGVCTHRLVLELVAAVVALAVLANPAAAFPAPMAHTLLDEPSISLTVAPSTGVVAAKEAPQALLELDPLGGDGLVGKVELIVDGELFDRRKAAPSMALKLPMTSVGQHTVTARFVAATGDVGPDTPPSTYDVTMVDTSIMATTYGGPQQPGSPVMVTVTPTASGLDEGPDVQVSEGDQSLGEVSMSPLYGGGMHGEFPLPDLPFGQHTLVFTYPGDDRSKGSSTEITVNVGDPATEFVYLLELDRPTAFVDADPVVATATLLPPDGPATPEGDLDFFVDGDLVASRPVSEGPITVDLPVDEQGTHQVTTALTETAAQTGGSNSASYEVVKAPTEIVVDTTGPFHRGDMLPISVVAAGSATPTGLLSVNQLWQVDLVGGRGEYPLGSVGGRLELHYEGDRRTLPANLTVDIDITPEAGETTIVWEVDRLEPVIGSEPVVATVSVLVEGGAVPKGELIFAPNFGDPPIAVRDAGNGPVTIEFPVDDLGSGPSVSFRPADETQRRSGTRLDYRVQGGTTQTRVSAPSKPVSTGTVLPFSVVVVNAPSVRAVGRVLVTDGEPSGCTWPGTSSDPRPFDPPRCANELALVTLVEQAGSVTLPELADGEHDMVFWYFPDATYPGSSSARTKKSRISVPVTVANGVRAVLDLDRHSTVAGGAPITATASVEGQPDTEGEIAFYVDDRLHATRPFSTGQVSTTVPVDAAGAHQVTAVYTGSETGAGPRSAAAAYSVAKATTSVAVTAPTDPVPSSARLDVSVTATDSSAVPQGELEVIRGQATIGKVDLTAGLGQFALAGLTAGRHALTFKYAGDANTEASAHETTVVVRGPVEPEVPPTRIPTSTSLTVDRDSVRPDETVTVVATVTTDDAAPATGGVEFIVDGSTVVTSSIVGGQAVATLPPAAIGPHVVTARYAGDATHATSRSAERRYVVAPQVSNPAASTVRAKIGILGRKLKIRATVRSGVAISGRLTVTQTVRVKTRSGKTVSRTTAVAGKVISAAGKTVKVSIRTRKLRRGPGKVTISYLGSTNVAASHRTYRVRIR